MIDVVLVHDRLDDTDAETVADTRLAQKLGVAAAPMAEDEIVADDDMGDGEAVHQHLLDEGRRRLGVKRLVEA